MDKKKIVFIAISTIVAVLVYLPTPKHIDPEQFHPADPTDLDQLPVSKNKLDGAVLLKTPAPGAQDVEIDRKGYIYSGLHDGSIIQVSPDYSDIKVIAKSQGPIFGVDLNSRGDKLAFADQVSGIKILNLKTGTMEYIISEYNGIKFASPNSVVFGSGDQILYFTVASQSIKMSQFHEMLLYSQGSGRIYAHNIQTNVTEVLADGLYFANGIQYSAKDNCLYFVETSRSRVSKLSLNPDTKGKITILTKNILGYPDNVKLTQSGELWVAVPALRDSFSNIIDNNSILRRVLLNLRVPLGGFLALANMKYAGGIKINPATGEIVDYLFGKSDNIDCISGINQRNGKIYLSSLGRDKIAVVDANAINQQRQKEVQGLRAKEQQDRAAEQQQRKEMRKYAKKAEAAPDKVQKKVEKVKEVKKQQRKEEVVVIKPQKVQVKEVQKEEKPTIETIKQSIQTVEQTVKEKVQEIKQVIEQKKEEVIKIIQEDKVEEKKAVPQKQIQEDTNQNETPSEPEPEVIVQPTPTPTHPKVAPQPSRPSRPAGQTQGQRPQQQPRQQRPQQGGYSNKGGNSRQQNHRQGGRV